MKINILACDEPVHSRDEPAPAVERAYLRTGTRGTVKKDLCEECARLLLSPFFTNGAARRVSTPVAAPNRRLRPGAPPHSKHAGSNIQKRVYAAQNNTDECAKYIAEHDATTVVDLVKHLDGAAGESAVQSYLRTLVADKRAVRIAQGAYVSPKRVKAVQDSIAMLRWGRPKGKHLGMTLKPHIYKAVRDVLRWFQTWPGAHAGPEVARGTGLSMVRWHLAGAHLQSHGLLHREGTKQGARWQLTPRGEAMKEEN